MKNLLAVCFIGLLFSCRKADSLTKPETKPALTSAKQLGCKALVPDASKSAARKRSWFTYFDSIININTGNLPKTCIYLDFDGAKVANTDWNNGATLLFAPANLTDEQKRSIVNNTKDDFSPFRVLITTDSAVYAQADPMNRQKVVITDESVWAAEGGMAIIGSSEFGNNTPCFVFSSLLSNSTKNIKEAVSHEIGHTMGLYHQAVYDASCNEVEQFNEGYGTGSTSFAPIMGIGFNKNIVNWYKGPTDYSCGDIQDDFSILSQRLGVWADDFDDITSFLSYTNLPHTGILNKAGDVDVVKTKITSPKKITVSSVNADIELKVYNAYFQLQHTVNDAGSPNATITLQKGTYYLSVQAATNKYANSRFMTGYYRISAKSSL